MAQLVARLVRNEKAGVRHNVEEVGLLEHFLPGLYAARDEHRAD